MFIVFELASVNEYTCNHLRIEISTGKYSQKRELMVIVPKQLSASSLTSSILNPLEIIKATPKHCSYWI
jgi:hypothetical protein